MSCDVSCDIQKDRNDALNKIVSTLVYQICRQNRSVYIEISKDVCTRVAFSRHLTAFRNIYRQS